MRLADLFAFSIRALTGFRLRSLLTLLAMAIGVAAVVLLTTLGEGARRYVVGEFASLGSDLLVVLPGRNETSGGPPPLTGDAARDITLDDAQALLRSPSVLQVAPLNIGSAPVSAGSREREVMIMGTTADYFAVRHLDVAAGQILPEASFDRAAAVAVLGASVASELFDRRAAVGQWIRIGDSRFRVIGVLGSEGQSLGFDMAEAVMIPVASAQALFNREGMFRVLIATKGRDWLASGKADVERIMRERHQGEEDVTVITQDSVLATFDKLFVALTLAVAAVGGVSLVVAGILVMNVMLVSVSQRTSEIGLLKALGATAQQVLWLFLVEAALLSLTGGVVGLVGGLSMTQLLVALYPSIPWAAPAWAVGAALGVALLFGMLFGLMPAWRAAQLDPVLALERR
jgi:putative ABC transport system permease protein